MQAFRDQVARDVVPELQKVMAMRAKRTGTRLRNEKARLLGYPSYAAYVTADEMAGTPAAVYELF